MAEVVCAIDLGTTGCRALLVQADGEVIAEHYVEYESHYGPEGAVEQDANVWWRVCVECIRHVLDEAGHPTVAVLGLSAQGHSWVLLDEELNPLRPALCWLDTRATPFCEKVTDGLGETRVGAVAGKLPGGWHMLPQLLMLREVDPAHVGQARWYAMCLDFVTAKFTGACVTEPTTAAGSLLFDIAKRRWSGEFVEAFGVPAEKLPRVMPSGSVAGALVGSAAAEIGLPEGIPVVIGGQDQKCAALGAGIQPGSATASLGTSTAVTVLAVAPGFDSVTHIPCFPYLLDDMWEWEAPLATTGGALRWLRDVLARDTDYAAMDAMAAVSPPGANGVTFEPHLAGAAAPHWQPARRGKFGGLSLSTSTGDIVRAVMEGVAHEIRLNVEALERLSHPIEHVHLFGGGARSELWVSILANVLSRPVTAVERVETAALGAAMMAASHGLHPDLSAAQEAMSAPSVVHESDSRTAAAYETLFERYVARD